MQPAGVHGRTLGAPASNRPRFVGCSPSASFSGAIAAIAPEKDADGLHPTNLGRLLAGAPSVLPCTPAGCMEIPDHYGRELKGVEAVGHRPPRPGGQRRDQPPAP